MNNYLLVDNRRQNMFKKIFEITITTHHSYTILNKRNCQQFQVVFRELYI